MQRTKATNGDSMLRLELGEKYPPDASKFKIIIGKERDGYWYRYKPAGGNNKPVDPKTGYELRRPTVVTKTTGKAGARHDTARERFGEDDRRRKAARVTTAKRTTRKR